jgi:hypothetical protein
VIAVASERGNGHPVISVVTVVPIKRVVCVATTLISSSIWWGATYTHRRRRVPRQRVSCGGTVGLRSGWGGAERVVHTGHVVLSRPTELTVAAVAVRVRQRNVGQGQPGASPLVHHRFKVAVSIAALWIRVTEELTSAGCRLPFHDTSSKPTAQFPSGWMGGLGCFLGHVLQHHVIAVVRDSLTAYIHVGDLF